MEDESFVRLIRGIRTAHGEHRGHWCSRDSHDEEQSLSFVLRIKLADRPVTGTFSVLKRRDLPEAGLATLSVLSHYEPHGLWYSCADVALVSSCHKNCKWPSGMWRQREMWMISDCISQADAKTRCFTLWTNKQNSHWFMSRVIALATRMLSGDWRGNVAIEFRWVFVCVSTKRDGIV